MNHLEKPATFRAMFSTRIINKLLINRLLKSLSNRRKLYTTFLSMLSEMKVLVLLVLAIMTQAKIEDKTKCPKVKAIRNFDLEQMLGNWYVIQYYASSEEALSYRCMRADFTMSPADQVTMNFNYSFTDDPINELLTGNITWAIPDLAVPSHWTHSEDTYEGIYNTFVLDSDYTSWSLLLHCAEKSKVPRYLSSFIMSRERTLPINVVSYLRDKLPKYDIDMDYMFEMIQNDCNTTALDGLPPSLVASRQNVYDRKHPMKHVH